MTVTSEHSRRLAETAAAVRAVFVSLAKLISARAIYTDNNPTLSRFKEAFYKSIQNVFEQEKELQLRVEQYRLLWRDEVVYENEDRGGSIAFMLFKDGVGELTLHPAVTSNELDQLVSIFKEEIHNPTPNSDTVTRLWNADFASITYRVLDEDPTGQNDGERGAGARLRTSLLQVEDHPGLPGDTDTIADHLLRVVSSSHPQSSSTDRERYVQDMLASLFSAGGDEQAAFIEERAEDARSDRIAMLLETALDFTRADDPSMRENALHLVERTAGFALAEADVRTLSRSLGLLRTGAREHPDQPTRDTLRRLEKDFVAPEFLSTLGRSDDLATEEILGALRYLREVGPGAVDSICDLMHAHIRSVVHREACDALLAVAGDRIDRVIEGLDIDNVHIARDVVYLLGAVDRNTDSRLLRELVHYPDVQVRTGALQLLGQAGAGAGGANSDSAVALLAVLLDDEDKGVRLQALAEIERIGGMVAGSKVMTLCTGEPTRRRGRDEMLRLFEVAGRIASDEIVAHLEETLRKRSWLRLRGQVDSQDKRLAVAALSAASGERARALLERLSRDGDPDIRARAQQALDDRSTT